MEAGSAAGLPRDLAEFREDFGDVAPAVGIQPSP